MYALKAATSPLLIASRATFTSGGSSSASLSVIERRVFQRLTTRFTCRAGCKERDVSRNQDSGPLWALSAILIPQDTDDFHLAGHSSPVAIGPRRAHNPLE